MSQRRVISAALLVVVLLLQVGCVSEQEQVWSQFVDAVGDGRMDDAMSHVDIERWTQRLSAEDPKAWDDAVSLVGSSEMAAASFEGSLRAALEGVEVEADGSRISRTGRPESAQAEGDLCTLTFDVEDGGLVVEMERVDGEWKIVGFR